ncbi:hypothetical protein [uncultured Friedmanniella sp.]|uniref:hypothetical protein n=1 Tax=uncultured Friedmanniella sp. TaxID=335381 RepID=UPI0035CACC70
MSTTSDPTPLDETLLDTTPTDPTPVEPTLAGAPDEPLLGTVPPAKPTVAEIAAARRESDLKALYAFAGITELAVGAVRSTVTDTSRWASARLAELRFRREELAKQAEEVARIQAEQVRKLAEGLPEDVKAVPEVAKGRVTELQEQATSTYSDLANRGQRALDGVRSDVAGRIDPAFDKIQERIDAARRAIKARAAAVAAAASVPEAPVADEPVVPEPTFADASEPVEAVVVEDVIVVEDVVLPDDVDLQEPDVEYPPRES